jgi:hypothetical protein
MNISQALQNLRPGAKWVCRGTSYDGLEWVDETQTQPTKEELEAEIARLQVEYDAKEYQRLRAPEYPDLKEFVDAYYWAQKGNDTKMNAYIVKCDAVKDKYPKPE